MITLFTETFEEYLNSIGGIEEFSTRFGEKFGAFPSFSLGDLDLDLIDLFIEKFKLREIGSETEQLFEHYLNKTLTELQIKYIPKINLYIENWNKLFDRKIELDSSNENSYYLNPVSTTGNLKLVDTDKSTAKREVPLPLLRESNTKMLNEILKLKDIYLDLLNDFEPLFMSVL